MFSRAKQIVMTAVFVLAGWVASAAEPSVGGAGIHWRKELMPAYRQACLEGKPLVVYFHVDYCDTCRGVCSAKNRFENECLQSEIFTALADEAIFVWQDAEKDDANHNVARMLEVLKVKRYPCVTVLAVRPGKYVETGGTDGGRFSADEFVKIIRRALDRARAEYANGANGQGDVAPPPPAISTGTSYTSPNPPKFRVITARDEQARAEIDSFLGGTKPVPPSSAPVAPAPVVARPAIQYPSAAPAAAKPQPGSGRVVQGEMVAVGNVPAAVMSTARKAAPDVNWLIAFKFPPMTMRDRVWYRLGGLPPKAPLLKVEVYEDGQLITVGPAQP